MRDFDELALDIRHILRYAHTRVMETAVRAHAFWYFGAWRRTRAVSQLESPCTIDCEAVGGPEDCGCCGPFAGGD